jgi:excisionase family DNA binding protein
MNPGPAVLSHERLLTAQEVSKWLNIPIRTVCLWAECSELPGMKIGRHWRFSREEIRMWLEGRRGNAHLSPPSRSSKAQ